MVRLHRTWPALWELGDTWPDGVGPFLSTRQSSLCDDDSRAYLQGEVDVLEGVNDQVPNASSLHTGPGMCCHHFIKSARSIGRTNSFFQTATCQRSANRPGKSCLPRTRANVAIADTMFFPPSNSITTGSDCYVYTTNNAGCGVRTTAPDNYGPPFNANGGGWYVQKPLTHSPSFTPPCKT